MAGNFMVSDLLISKNSKTGRSINVSRCQPTPWCIQHCYRMKRTRELIERMGWCETSTPNTGPITWKVQQNAYARNDRVLIRLAATGRLEEAAAGVAARLGNNQILRGNGTGDLFPELVDFYAILASKCIKVYAFSRIPKMIDRLRYLCESIGVTSDNMPYIIGSIDPSTPIEDCKTLAVATEQINGEAALAYATAACGRIGCEEVDGHPLRRHIKIVFGYHSTVTRTVLGHALECPATAGKDVKCDACRRCYGPGR